MFLAFLEIHLIIFNMAHKTLEDLTPDKANSLILYHSLLPMFHSSHTEFPRTSKTHAISSTWTFACINILSSVTFFCPSGHHLLNLLCILLVFPSNVMYYWNYILLTLDCYLYIIVYTHQFYHLEPTLSNKTFCDNVNVLYLPCIIM